MGKAVAIGAWCFGLWATHENISRGGLQEEYVLIVAFAIQAILTKMESGVWRGNYNIPGIVSLFIDSWLNFGFLYPALQNLNQWDSYQQAVIAFGFPDNPPTLLLGILAMAIGAVIAIAPEYIWEK